jgi:hypothetical protein
LLDILRIGSEVGLDLRKYHYLGFGGFRFYDFEMLFRHLGIRDMTSVELDETLYPRCRFNKPFSFIQFEEGHLSDYLEKATFRKPLVAWLDYDCVLSNDVVEDIRSISAKAPVGSVLFATVDARIPEGMRAQGSEARFAAVKEEYHEFALVTRADELEPDRYPAFAERVLWASLKESLSKRSDGVFVPLIRVFYRDSALMMTVGACLCERDFAREFAARMKRQFKFLLPTGTASPYAIPPFNLTSRERRLLDSAVTRRARQQSLTKSLRRLGFTNLEIADYKRMFRFVPKYYEAFV